MTVASISQGLKGVIANGLQNTGLRVPVLALAVAAAIAWPQFRSDYWSFVASIGLIWALMALSLSILAGWTGEVSLAHAAFLGMGAYVAGRVGDVAPFPVDLIAGTAVGLPMSLLLGVPALRLRGLNLMVATLAFMLVMQNAVFGRLVGSTNIIPVERPGLLGLSLSGDRSFYYVVLLFVGGSFALTWWASKGMLRRAFIAMGDSHIAFSALGGSVVSYKLLAFALSGLCAALAGVLWGMLNRHVSSVSLTVTQSTFFLAFAVLGGRGSLMGALIAGVLFGIIPEIYRSIPQMTQYTFLLSGVGLVLLLLQYPGGLASMPSELQKMFARRRQGADSLAAQSDTLWPQTASLTIASSGGPLRSILSRTAAGTLTDGALLTVEHAGIRFGGVTALSDVSLSVPPGEIVGLIGPNGAGKTTMLNCISGFYRPNFGRVLFAGRDITRWSVSRRARAGMARTFQTPKLFHGLTVEENVLAAFHLRRTSLFGPLTPDGMRPPRPEDREYAHFLLSLVGLTDRASEPAPDLPHGAARALELARALATSPSLLLLDEPVAGLDRTESEAFGELLRLLRGKLGLTMLVVEHDMTWVMDLCERLFVLDFGVLLAHGTPEEVRENDQVIAAYLGRGISHAGG